MRSDNSVYLNEENVTNIFTDFKILPKLIGVEQ